MNNNLKLKLSLDQKDEVFSRDLEPVIDFKFNAKVADVFDDMVSRSVPYYDEMQRQVCELASDFAKPGTNLYDIGCSTATTLIALDAVIEPGLKFIGVDNAPDMLAKARIKLEAAQCHRKVELQYADLNGPFSIENASVVTMLLTLQFVRPLHRERVMRAIYEGMLQDGCLLLVEKLTCEETVFNRLYIDHYYEFKKRNGYSEIEIAKKREALENVLIPYRLEENIQLLKETGFRNTEVFFRWYNFCGIIAIK